MIYATTFGLEQIFPEYPKPDIIPYVPKKRLRQN